MIKVNGERIRSRIDGINRFNSTPGEGITRLSYSKEDVKAREYLKGEMEAMGLKVKIDPVGNIRARLEGIDPKAPPVLTGSHIDTVLHGGRFDGVVGVVAALEVLNIMVENNLRCHHPIEAVIFVEEEGPNFGSPLAGSKALTGAYNTVKLQELVNDQGVSMYEAAQQLGLNPEEIEKSILRPGDIKAMIEMHVEQSLVLDVEGLPVGIVEAIAGMKWISIELKGMSNHAGATPMVYRQDPMVGAAHIIAAIDQIVRDDGLPSTVGTVGKINCYPNVPNVIPEKVNFILDLRDVEKEGMDRVFNKVQEKVQEVAGKYKLEYQIELKGDTEPIKLSPEVIRVMEEAANKKGISYRKMNSGALHDACVLANAGIGEVGMIFVPSIKGRSHVPEEETSLKDIEIGCELLLETVLKLAGNK